MKFSAFARLGGGLRFTAKPPDAQRIYEGMVRAIGGDTMVAEGGEGLDETIHARLYAIAMELATVKGCFDRVRANMNPGKSVELLSYWERVLGVVPSLHSTDDERRTAVDIANRVSAGCNPYNLYSVLRDLIGNDLIAVRKTAAVESATVPSYWDVPGARPGTWKSPSTTIRLRTLDASIATLGAVTVGTTYSGADDSMFVAGDDVVVEPGKLGCQEAVTVDSADGDNITATFSKPHPSGSLVISTPWPTAYATGRSFLVVVSSSIARSALSRARINARLEKLMRAVDTWDIVEETSPGVTGPYQHSQPSTNIVTVGTVNI